MTEHGISYRGRPPGKRSAQSHREGHVSKGADGRAIHRGKGHRWSDDQQPCGKRDAESHSGIERHWSPLGDRIDHWRARVTRKRSRFVRRGAIGKGLSQDSTSPVAYSTWHIRSSKEWMLRTDVPRSQHKPAQAYPCDGALQKRSSPVQKSLDCRHHFVIPVAADVVTSARNMHHLTMLPEVCRFLGRFGRDNRT